LDLRDEDALEHDGSEEVGGVQGFDGGGMSNRRRRLWKLMSRPSLESGKLDSIAGVAMKVYDIHDKEGRIIAFEVKNFLSWRLGIIRIIAKIPGAETTWRPSLSWYSPEVFCKFQIDGIDFEVWEPFGDNSRYWIGPDPARWVPQIERVRDAFARGKWYGP
jgi:hypothetical protein